MTQNVFEDIKALVTLPLAANHYGLSPNTAQMVCCPFHDDKHPSAKVYPERLVCFTCGQSWDVVALVANLHGLKPLDAARMIDADFRLGLFAVKDTTDADKQQAAEAAAKRKQDLQLVNAFDTWCENALATVTWYLWDLRRQQRIFAPTALGDPITDAYAHVIHELDVAEYLFDTLAFATYPEKLGIYKHHRKKVQEIDHYRESNFHCDGA